MSGIISDPAFNNMYTATKDDNTMQATVTAVYEVGMLLRLRHPLERIKKANTNTGTSRLSPRRYLCAHVW